VTAVPPWPGRRASDGGFDRIPTPAAGGALWLCGKHAIGPDPDAALAEVGGAAVVVCLNETHELIERYPRYVSWLREHDGGAAIWWPIADLHAPPVHEALPFVDDLACRLRRGDDLLVHCGAGIGRAGTIAACILVRLGAPVVDALAIVAANRPMAGPEVGPQRDLVHDPLLLG